MADKFIEEMREKYGDDFSGARDIYIGVPPIEVQAYIISKSEILKYQSEQTRNERGHSQIG